MGLVGLLSGPGKVGGDAFEYLFGFAGAEFGFEPFSGGLIGLLPVASADTVASWQGV